MTEFRLLLIKITRYLRTNANINIFLGLFPMYHESSITIPINIARHRRKIQNYSRGPKAQKNQCHNVNLVYFPFIVQCVFTQANKRTTYRCPCTKGRHNNNVALLCVSGNVSYYHQQFFSFIATEIKYVRMVLLWNMLQNV